MKWFYTVLLVLMFAALVSGAAGVDPYRSYGVSRYYLLTACLLGALLFTVSFVQTFLHVWGIIGC